MIKADCLKEIDEANSLNEIWDVLNKHYNLDKQFGSVSGALVRAQIKDKMGKIIVKLSIQERSRKKLF